jgi:LTXXQ motif family protein
MSRSRIGIAVVVLATLLSGTAQARARLGLLGAPLGVARFAATRLFALGGLHRAYSVSRRSHIRSASLRPEDIGTATSSGRPLGNPAAREQVVAAAAMAGWHGGRIASGWWRHGDGGYGWVGPLFWPFAYQDIYDYTVRGDGIGFWAYGYGDIYAGIFAPYDQDDLAGYTLSDLSGRRHRRIPPLQQLCGDDSREIAGLPIDQIQQAVQPTEAQRAALDELANASVSAAQMIRASCPTQAASSGSARLAAMQERLQAMIKAVSAMQPPLETFYGLLDDVQKARLNALAEDRRKIPGTRRDKTNATGTNSAGTNRASEAQGCEAQPSAALKWPADEIDATLHLDDNQRAALEVLQDAGENAADMLNGDCRPDAITPPARLAAASRRLDVMLQAVKLVADALNDFYDTLRDEQKAQFEAIGPKRTA